MFLSPSLLFSECCGASSGIVQKARRLSLEPAEWKISCLHNRDIAWRVTKFTEGKFFVEKETLTLILRKSAFIISQSFNLYHGGTHDVCRSRHEGFSHPLTSLSTIYLISLIIDKVMMWSLKSEPFDLFILETDFSFNELGCQSCFNLQNVFQLLEILI